MIFKREGFDINNAPDNVKTTTNSRCFNTTKEYKALAVFSDFKKKERKRKEKKEEKKG